MKFLQKIDIRLYLFILFSFILFFINIDVKAYTNLDTSFNIDMPDYETDLKSYTCGNTNLYDFINSFISSIDFSTSYYQIFISKEFTSGSSYPLYLDVIPTTSLNNQYGNLAWVRGRYYSNTYQNRFEIYATQNGSGTFNFKFDNCSNDLDVANSQIITHLRNFIVSNDTTIFSDGTSSPIGFLLYGTTQPAYNVYEILSSLNNNDSYNVSSWYYYNSYDMYMPTASIVSNSSAYWKNLHFVNENEDISLGDKLKGYYDFYYDPNPEPSYSYIGYSTSLKTFYTNLNPSDVSNYNLKVNFKVPQSYLGFYQTPTEYVYNTQFDYVCGGRVDNTNYYSYETFPCSLDFSYSLTESTIEYTFYNITTNQILSNYDKVYITIKSNYLDSNVSTTIFNFSYLYNLGSFYNTDYKGAIYENFDNLPLNFKVYLSSNNSLTDSNLYVRKYQFLNYNIKYIGFSNITNQQNLVIGNSILGRANTEFLNGEVEESDFLETNVSNSIDQGIMIYQDNSLIPLPSLQLFFNGCVVISINNSTNDFYYIDSNGNIINNTFTKPIITDSSKYDISYYLNQVNDFINDLSNDTLELSLLTQEFYNGMPMIFQTFILVIFILACTYFLFVLIKRW